MTNPVAEVAAEQDAPSPGGADPDPDGPAHAGDPTPEEAAEALGGAEPVEQEPTSVAGKLMEPMESDPLADHLREMWAPQRGGLNRVVGVLKEVAGVEEELPRGAHALIGAVEFYYNHADGLTGEQEAQDDGTTISRDQFA